MLQLQITEVWETTLSESGNPKTHLDELTKVRQMSKENPASIFSLLVLLKGKLPQISQSVMWVLEKCFSVDPKLKGPLFFYF